MKSRPIFTVGQTAVTAWTSGLKVGCRQVVPNSPPSTHFIRADFQPEVFEHIVHYQEEPFHLPPLTEKGEGGPISFI